MTSRRTGPRRLPTWTVPDGVFELLMTCGPETLRASSSAQSSGGCSFIAARRGPASPDRDDLVGEVAGGNADEDLLTLLVAEQRAPDGALVRDPALGWLRLRRPDDREGLLAV